MTLIRGRKRHIIIGVFLLGAFSGLFLVSEKHASRESGFFTGTVSSNTAFPVRLIVPSINIDASIEPVGVTPTGAMATPNEPEITAWYRGGPVPGEKGSAVIAGHYGWKNGQPASFDNLSKLKKGDMVTVQDSASKKTTFIVREIRTYTQTSDATDIFTSSSGSHLNLITCGGAWNAAEKSYDERLVVFTDLVK